MSQFESKFESLSAVPQKKYRNHSQRVMLNILYTSNWMSERIKAVLDPEGVTMQQFNIMRIIRGAQKPLSLIQIKESLLDKMSDTSRVVDRLIIKGLVEKSQSEADRRVLEITLTKKGLKVLDDIDKRDADLDGIVNGITDEESLELCRILDKIRGYRHN